MEGDFEITICGHIYCALCVESVERHGCLVSDDCKKKNELTGETALLTMEVLSKLSRDCAAEVQPSTSGESHIRSSPKFDALLKILAVVPTYMNGKGVRVREKTLVFSQWTSALDLLEPHVMGAGYKFSRIDGTMQQSTRTQVLKKFEESPDISVILLSLHAASVGLNMTFANHVVLLDNWWNPTVEDQAVDRAHRLGQTKTVVVHFVVLDESIEQTVLSLANRKRLMISDIFNYVGKGKKSKQIQDLDFLFQGMQCLQSIGERKADDPSVGVQHSDLVRAYDHSGSDDGSDSDFWR